MSESKQTPVTRFTNFVRRNERRILVTTTLVSTTVAVMQASGIKQHNEFLKENGLFDKFYALTPEES